MDIFLSVLKEGSQEIGKNQLAANIFKSGASSGWRRG
jgi:hypothetical protein